jgi:hypothetical protein
MKRRSVLTGAAAVVLAGAIGGGAAYAASSPAPQVAGAPSAQLIHTTGSVTSNTTTADKTHPGLAKRARRVVHGQFTIKTKDGFRTVVTQRGEVTAVSPTSLTVTSPDHYAHTYTLGSTTRVRKDKAKATLTELSKGDHVRVVTSPKLGTNTAAIVIDRTK